LASRVQRRHAGAAVSLLGDETLSFNLSTRELTFQGHGEPLPARELDLMAALLERPGSILSRTQLEDRISGNAPALAGNPRLYIEAFRRCVLVG
jgi:DNA-binding response OmpR family regulator